MARSAATGKMITTLKTKTMKNERNEQQFTEQEAPLKNTDKAFVQVGSNGEPQIPSGQTGNQKEQAETDRNKEQEQE